MPRYFFHVYHEQPKIDHEGEELPDKHAAWKEATVIAGRTLQGLDGKLQPGRGWRMEVTDEIRQFPFMFCIFMQRSPGKVEARAAPVVPPEFDGALASSAPTH